MFKISVSLSLWCKHNMCPHEEYINNDCTITKKTLEMYSSYLNDKYPHMFEDYVKFRKSIAKTNKKVIVDSINFLIYTKIN